MHVAKHPVRMVTAASLFDGHDAAINIMRRVLQSQGVEVIHLGHNRSVAEVVRAAIQEDVQAVAISSYQGGHMEYFTYLVDLLAEHGAGHVKVYGGGGGVIVANEIEELHWRGVARIFSPEDGQRMGLAGMINSIVRECDFDMCDIASDSLARLLTRIELGRATVSSGRAAPVLGITGTGGSGKSSLTDELIRRLRVDQDDKLRIAVLAIDPSRSRGGGALLGDRIRMNSIADDRIFFRSLSTRGSHAVPAHLHQMIAACQEDGFDLIIVETPGIGQGDTGIVDFCDVSLYVMTPEFGAASQLEKIDMLDHADLVAINKFERHGGEDALRDVCRQMVRNRGAFGTPPDQMPVYGTIASRFNDDGVDALYHGLKELLAAKGLQLQPGRIPVPAAKTSTRAAAIIPPQRTRYLSEIASVVRGYHERTDELVSLVRQRQQLAAVRDLLPSDERDVVERLHAGTSERLGPAAAELDQWEEVRAAVAPTRTSLSGSEIRRVSLPRGDEHGALMRYLRSENRPGSFPFTAGVFPFKREDEDPTRMFAGEGDPARTNLRFKLLSADSAATRLSTAFDSVTLYGHDPALRPDIYGKVGTSGVSIATLTDMKDLFDGFDLAAPTTSVSMTINGPAPTILAFFLNAAIDQGGPSVLESIRGTVQADILKEDQGQNTCLFSTEFSLRMMADVQEWFIQNNVRNFYSVSISGYHIAEAGANPITQLAFTLANGFTYVEAYLARGMHIDDFAPNLSFFFSNGMDPEYTVLGRVARRLWAIAMRERYGANERSQKLKYHVQTSGRSLHAQEMNFNDIRTTLQALTAIYDNCNSLHTNAYDEAVTTPTAESVRRAMAIQLIINREWGLAVNENPLQGSYIVDELTDLVEQAVLAEFERLSNRGGVLGAMETGYQRGRIQDESMLYEQRKHDGSLPIIGVNTFRDPNGEPVAALAELARGTEAEKQSQLDRLGGFQQAHAAEAGAALLRLREAAATDANLFAVLMDVARVCSLEQITQAFFEAGGQYRRSM